jgi:hypothetical protein
LKNSKFKPAKQSEFKLEFKSANRKQKLEKNQNIKKGEEAYLAEAYRAGPAYGPVKDTDSVSADRRDPPRGRPSSSTSYQPSSSLSSSPPLTAPGFVPPPSEVYKILYAAIEEP